VAGSLRLDMAQYRDLAAFAQFGADQLDKATQAQLGRGQRLTEILKQDQYAPFTVEKQVLSLFVATSGALDSIPVPAVRRFEREFLAFVETNYPGILKTIAEKKALDDNIKSEIKKAVEAFKERFATDVEEAGESASKAAAAPAKNQDGTGAVVTPKSEDPSAKKEETPVAK
jgi:F-type H+-transporting ATPase subunit alpha